MDRYALKDASGNPVEKSIFDTFRRVAKAIASKESDPRKWEKEFFEVMSNRLFCPAGRILANAGTHFSQLLNCYVIPFEDDSLEAIMDTARKVAVTQKFGGGTGHNYSPLRPAGSHIKGVNGRSCGVPGFIDMMSVMSGVIEQGGSRRGANLGLLEVWHPDVWEFISFKNEHEWDHLLNFVTVNDPKKWEQFKHENAYKLQMYNISIGVSDEFLTALEKNRTWPLYWKDKEWELYKVQFQSSSEIREFEVTADSEETAFWKVRRKIPFLHPGDSFEAIDRRKLQASEIWQKLCYNAWANGCPGIINLSECRRMHNGEYYDTLISTNPCGEQPLVKYGSCNLSSIVLPSFYNPDTEDVNYPLLEKTIHTAVRFLDDVTDCCDFPMKEAKEVSQKERRIGLGTVGVHDLLISLKLGYDTEEGRKKIAEVLSFIRDKAYEASVELSKEKGSFPAFDANKYLESGFAKTLPESVREKISRHGIRNVCLLSQAPTGTTGTVLSTSTGCEPWFALSFTRRTGLGSYEDGCREYIRWRGEHPNEDRPNYFKPAMEIDPEDHLKMMLVFTKYIDSAVSKTINLPNKTTVQEVGDVLLKAFKQGVKGMTVFRDGCRMGVLESKDKEEKPDRHEEDREEAIQPEIPKEPPANTQSLGWRKRGNRTLGATTRIYLNNHNMYVTVNRNEMGNTVEVFATVGESKDANTFHTSGIEDSWAEGLGKIISLALRAGVDPEAIIRNLKNIPSDKPVFATIGKCESSELIPSPPHAIARVMEEELKYSHRHEIKNEAQDKKGCCSSCGSSNINPRSPTCYECLDCGYSGCG